MQCTRPIKVSNGVFPCGKCLNCRIGKAREWSARLIHELSYWSDSLFVTLTYEDKYLPANNSLCKKDLQLFFKRLRKCLNRKIKYYACGEYGSTVVYANGLGRPHYHAIIFGVGQKDIESIKDCWRKCQWSNFDSKKAFGSVTYDSCRYVSDYIFKKYSGELAQEVYTSKGVEIPFKISSQGLGLSYCLLEADNLRNNLSFTLRGVPMALPRYYVEKLGITLESQNDVDVKRWKHYADRIGVNEADIADLIDDNRKQRELNTERRLSLHKKGVF